MAPRARPGRGGKPERMWQAIVTACLFVVALYIIGLDSGSCSSTETAGLLADVAEGQPVELVAAHRPPCAPVSEVAVPRSSRPLRRVFDIFVYRGGADALEIRLRELDAVVDTFFAIDCGLRPTLRQLEVRKRWAFVAQRFMVVPCGEEDAFEAGERFLESIDTHPDDLVILGRAEEIPSARSIAVALEDPVVRRWVTASTPSVFHELLCAPSKFPTRPGADDHMYPLVVRLSEPLAVTRALARMDTASFSVLPEGIHLSHRADPVLLLMDLARANRTVPEELLGRATAGDVRRFCQRLARFGDAEIAPGIYECPRSWIPEFMVRNRARFRF